MHAPCLPKNFWSPRFRLLVFVLAATSIWCLLAEFYGLCSMRAFTGFVSVPSILALGGLALANRAWGDQRLWRGVMIGALAGLFAAVAYDGFRLPFVLADSLGIQRWVPSLKLFKVFPQFGARILGQPLGQPTYSLGVHLLGWTYHFSNGLTFGIMYLAMIGDARRRHWAWAMGLAVGLELAMLLTPYPSFFGIALTARFIAVTCAAHLLFGVMLGLAALRLTRVLTPAFSP